MLKALLVAGLLAGTALPALAANADHPDQNVNKANDKGGDTGNGKVDDLNRAQLDQPAKRAEPPPAAPAK